MRDEGGDSVFELSVKGSARRIWQVGGPGSGSVSPPRRPRPIPSNRPPVARMCVYALIWCGMSGGVEKGSGRVGRGDPRSHGAPASLRVAARSIRPRPGQQGQPPYERPLRRRRLGTRFVGPANRARLSVRPVRSDPRRRRPRGCRCAVRRRHRAVLLHPNRHPLLAGRRRRAGAPLPRLDMTPLPLCVLTSRHPNPYMDAVAQVRRCPAWI